MQAGSEAPATARTKGFCSRCTTRTSLGIRRAEASCGASHPALSPQSYSPAGERGALGPTRGHDLDL